jgi:hypothetical protein
LRVTGALAAVREILRAEGMEERVGSVGRERSMTDLIDSFRGEMQAAERPT